MLLLALIICFLQSCSGSKNCSTAEAMNSTGAMMYMLSNVMAGLRKAFKALHS